MRLERADLVLLSHTLQQLQRPTHIEVATARDAWPTLNRGLPAPVTAALALDIETAAARAGRLVLPAAVRKEDGLTGPAAQIGGLLKSYSLLTRRGWQFLARAGRAASENSTAAATFLRANAPLYIYCVYDGHFDLSLIAAKLHTAYAKLGGAAAFGLALTPAEVTALAGAYSIPAVRLAPHPPPSLKL